MPTMTTPARRRLAAASLVLLVPVLGACGFSEQTDQVYQPSVGVNNRDGVVDVLGAVVVSGTPGSGTFVASLVNKGTSKSVSLQSVTGDSGTTAQLVKPVSVGAGDLVNLAGVGAVDVTGQAISAGAFARLTLTFDNGQSTQVNVPIVSRDGDYSEVAPAIPSASPSASSSAKPSATPSATPSGSPSASATPTP